MRPSVLVLIADDEGPIAAVVAALVKDLGYRSAVARNGKQALEMARAAWPSLLITDLMMPGLTGAELIAALHAEAEAAHRTPPPAILMTAAGIHRARGAGADAVLPKPFDMAELEELLERFLDHT